MIFNVETISTPVLVVACGLVRLASWLVGAA